MYIYDAHDYLAVLKNALLRRIPNLVLILALIGALVIIAGYCCYFYIRRLTKQSTTLIVPIICNK
jgi:hypothetical protein